MSTIAIVGCGVSGLTCGIRLAEKGHTVEIFAREESPNTTSDVAAAFWYPFRAEPRERVVPWAERSYREFALLAEDPESGVQAVPITHHYCDTKADVWWAGSVEGFCNLDASELPQGYDSAVRYQTFLIETPIYMPYLRSRFEDLGGTVRIENVESLESLGKRIEVIVNCAGVWAGTLTDDPHVFPIRGQTIRTHRPKSLPPSILDAEGLFVSCRTDDCIIGGANEDGSWELQPKVSDRELLLQRIQKLCPELAAPEILEERVGLRPGRNAVRVEKEIKYAGPLIHNYGHGGAGFTLSWGCAEEVAELVGRPKSAN